MDTFELYVDSNHFSPYALSVFVALTEKGLPFTLHTLDLGAGQHHQRDYSAISLTQRVPTLVQGDFRLSESSAIDEYLEESFPAPKYPALYPADRQQRARAREIQAWLRSDLGGLRNDRPTDVIFKAPTSVSLSPEGRASAEQLIKAAQRLLGGRLSLFEQWCIADTELALMLGRLHFNGDPLPDDLTAYVRHQWQRPSVQRWLQLSRTDG